MNIKEVSEQIGYRQEKIEQLSKQLGYIKESDKLYVSMPGQFTGSRLTINHYHYGETVRELGSDYLGKNKREVNDSLYRIMIMLYQIKQERENTTKETALIILKGEALEIFSQLIKDGTEATDALNIALNLVKVGA